MHQSRFFKITNMFNVILEMKFWRKFANYNIPYFVSAEPTPKTDPETTTVRPTKVKCKGVGDWNSKSLMQFWCNTKCMKNPDACPRNMCKCKFD